MLAEYVQIGAEEDRQQCPLLLPAIPSRASSLTLLDAFEAVYRNRTERASPHAWAYFGNLGGYATTVRLSDNDADQRDRPSWAKSHIVALCLSPRMFGRLRATSGGGC